MAGKKRWFHGGPVIDWQNADIRLDRNRSESDLNANGPGVYWTTDLEEAAGYGTMIYEATLRDDFHMMPHKRPAFAALYRLYNYAPDDSKETFLSNWGENARPGDALRHYTHQESLFDACVTLYHDLFLYDAADYTAALIAIGFDGHIVERGMSGGSRRRQHLIAWNHRKLIIEPYEG